MEKEKMDKVIGSLKEINQILKETNLEMHKALNGGEVMESKFVIQFGGNPEAFITCSNYTDTYWFNTVAKATQFNTAKEAQEEINRLIAECDKQFVVIRKVKMVVEND